MSDIFVFGSNLIGRHGAGSAKWAKDFHGAIYGEGIGRHGNSYAIPTKDEKIQTLPLERIEPHIKVFLDYALMHPHLQFYVVPVGCGLAGYKPEQIAPMFKGVPQNVHLPEEFIPYLSTPM